MKVCKRCDIEKSIDNFYLQKSGYLYPFCKACNTIRATEWKRNNRHKQHLSKIKSKFKLSSDEYNSLVNKQKGLCKICGNKEKNRRLGVDHCHKTLKVRGLLCNTCNLGIGYFKDDILLLKKAIKYLNEGIFVER